MTKDPKDPNDLSSFRISELRRPEVRSFNKGAGGKKGKDAPPASISVGFPSIERRLEATDVEGVADELRPSYESLEKLTEGPDPRLKQAAKKAMAAYERTADLFEYLFATKGVLAGEKPDAS